jgi:N-methylhydantoinase A
MALDRDLATAAVERGLAVPLGLSVEDAAEGLLRIANANMVAAIRLITVERGFDPREFSLIAFGGAGPLHAVDIARELDMPEVIVPTHPGVTSALGLLFVDPLDDFSWAYVKRQDELDLDDLRTVFEDIGSRVQDNLALQGLERSELTLERSLDLRYIGQLHSITVPLADLSEDGFARAVAAFHGEHTRQYRYSHPENPVEISTLRVSARGHRAKPELRAMRFAAPAGENGAGRPERRRDVHFPGVGWVSTTVLDRGMLAVGAELVGPCVIEGIDATVVLPPATTAVVGDGGDIVISLRDA